MICENVDIINSTYHVNMHNIPAKSMRLMVKVVCTFKMELRELCLLAQLRDFHFFAVLLSTGTMYTQNECPHLKNICRIMKRG